MLDLIGNVYTLDEKRSTNIKTYCQKVAFVINSVKTRSQERNQKDVKKVDFDEYIIKKKHWQTVKKTS